MSTPRDLPTSRHHAGDALDQHLRRDNRDGVGLRGETTDPRRRALAPTGRS